MGGMAVGGLKIQDINDAKDFLIALETIKAELENISDNMNINYVNYNSLEEDITNNISTQKENNRIIQFYYDKLKEVDTDFKEVIANAESLGLMNKTYANDVAEITKKRIDNFTKNIDEIIDKSLKNLTLKDVDIKIINELKFSLMVFDGIKVELNETKEELNKSIIRVEKVDAILKNSLAKINDFERPLQKKLQLLSFGAGAISAFALVLFFSYFNTFISFIEKNHIADIGLYFANIVLLFFLLYKISINYLIKKVKNANKARQQQIW